MANFNEAIRWSNETPAIYLTVTYGKYRDGANMVYSVGLSVSALTGSYYFGYPIYAKIYVNGESEPRFTQTLKNSSPSRWSNPLTYNTGEFTVLNKTTGVTSLAVNLYSSSGIRNETYYFDMAVDPAYFTNQPTLTLQSKTETSITYKWTTSETCDNIVWHGTGTASTTGVEGTTGTVTFSGLTADTSYKHYGTFRRKDSGLTTDSNKPTNSTDNYPYVTSLSPQIITLGNTITQTVNISNPHSRQTTVYVKLNDSSGTTIASATTSGTSATITIPTNDLYQQITDTQSGTLYYYCVYNNHTTTGINGTYKINGNERPTFPTSSWSYVANLTSLTNDNQIVIDGYSTINITINTPASSDYYASILNYYATWGNATPVTFNENETATLSKGNGTSIVVLANDSRQLQSALQASTLDISSKRVLYTKPVVNVSETHRLNGIDTLVTLNAVGTMYKGTFGANGVQNAIASVGYRVKGVGQPDSAYSQLYPISLNNCSFDSSTGEWTISNASIHQNGQSGGFPTGSSYNVKLEFYDAQGLLGFGTYVSTVEDGTLGIDRYKDSNGEYHTGHNGLADGDYCDKFYGNVDVEGTIFVNGQPFQPGSNINVKNAKSNSTTDTYSCNYANLMAYPVGSIYISDNSTSPASLFGGTWEQLNGYYLYFGNGYNKTNYTGKNTQNHTLTANQSGLRSHSHPINTAKTAANSNTWNDKVKCADGGSAWNFNTHDERSILNEGPWDAAEGHSHNIATIEVYAWRRTA